MAVTRLHLAAAIAVAYGGLLIAGYYLARDCSVEHGQLAAFLEVVVAPLLAISFLGALTPSIRSEWLFWLLIVVAPLLALVLAVLVGHMGVVETCGLF